MGTVSLCQDGHSRSCPAVAMSPVPSPSPSHSCHPCPKLQPGLSLPADHSHLLSCWGEGACTTSPPSHLQTFQKSPYIIPVSPEGDGVCKEVLPMLIVLPQQLWTRPSQQHRALQPHSAVPIPVPIPVPCSLGSCTAAGSFPVIAVSAEFTASLRVINNNALTLK